MKKLMLLAALAVGYVLGTKAGRERYNELKRMFVKVKDDPRVQEKAHQAVEFAVDKAPVVKDKVTEVAGAAAAKVGGSSGGNGVDLNPDRIKLGTNSGPQGDLP